MKKGPYRTLLEQAADDSFADDEQPAPPGGTGTPPARRGGTVTPQEAIPQSPDSTAPADFMCGASVADNGSNSHSEEKLFPEGGVFVSRTPSVDYGSNSLSEDELLPEDGVFVARTPAVSLSEEELLPEDGVFVARTPAVVDYGRNSLSEDELLPEDGVFVARTPLPPSPSVTDNGSPPSPYAPVVEGSAQELVYSNSFLYASFLL